MTKRRAWMIWWAVVAPIIAGNLVLLIVGLVYDIPPMIGIPMFVLIFSIIWAGLPATLISDSSLPDPKEDRRREEHELLCAALVALRAELYVVMRRDNIHESEYAASVHRSLIERARNSYPYLPDWFERGPSLAEIEAASRV